MKMKITTGFIPRVMMVDRVIDMQRKSMVLDQRDFQEYDGSLKIAFRP